MLSLAYLELRSQAVDQWRDFATRVLGMEARSEGAAALALRMDGRDHRVLVAPAERSGLGALGFETPELEALAARLDAAGVAVHEGSADERERRRAARLVWCLDPAGNRVELANGLADGAAPFTPARPIAGFRTGALGLGHAVLLVEDLARARAFYEGLLGFRLSDYFGEPPLGCFLRCNERHHSIGLFGFGANALDHVMFEVESLHDVGRGLDAFREGGGTLAAELGWHSNDRMTSFYAWGPGRALVEYGFGGRSVPWDAKAEPVGPGSWGHRGLLDSHRELVGSAR